MSALVDLTGQRFASLTVVSRAENIGRRIRYLCLCDCNKTTTVDASNLRRGLTKSCGCLRQGRKVIDLTGKVFGRLTVFGRLQDQKPGIAKWICRCSCGREKIVVSKSLVAGKCTSCGCARGSHHATKTKTYNAWKVMRQRCRDANATGHERYVDRGICVCERWHDYSNFLADMGPRPFPGASIDRVNNDGPYSPENCRWSTPSQQARNKSNNHFLEMNGETKILSDWAAQFGINVSTLGFRLKRCGNDLALALQKPWPLKGGAI